MLQQVLVISSTGMCLVDRQYATLKVDPQLLAGFLSAVVPKMEEFGYDLNSIHREIIGDINTYLEVINEGNFLCAGIAEKKTERQKVKEILEAANTMVIGQIGIYDPMYYSTLPASTFTIIEDQIDLMVAKKGISATSSRDSAGLLPIINQVQSGKIDAKRAAKMLLDWIQSADLDKDEIDLMKNSLNFIDKLISVTNQGKLDELQVVIRATVQGVSKLTVKMDDALSF
jgi:hypothetical protein